MEPRGRKKQGYANCSPAVAVGENALCNCGLWYAAMLDVLRIFPAYPAGRISVLFHRRLLRRYRRAPAYFGLAGLASDRPYRSFFRWALMLSAAPVS